MPSPQAKGKPEACWSLGLPLGGGLCRGPPRWTGAPASVMRGRGMCASPPPWARAGPTAPFPLYAHGAQRQQGQGNGHHTRGLGRPAPNARARLWHAPPSFLCRRQGKRQAHAGQSARSCLWRCRAGPRSQGPWGWAGITPVDPPAVGPVLCGVGTALRAFPVRNCRHGPREADHQPRRYKSTTGA